MNISQGRARAQPLVPEALRHLHSADIAKLLADREPVAAWASLAVLPWHERAEVFGYLPIRYQVAVAQVLPAADFAELARNMDVDELADLWAALPQSARDGFAPLLAAAEEAELRELTAFLAGTAGSVMTPEFAALPLGITARDAIEALREQAPAKETIRVAFVLSPERRLLGTVPLETLVLAPAETLVDDLMARDLHTVDSSAPAALAARLLARYDLLAVPVLGPDGAMRGVITADDAMDVAEEEATEDFQKAGGAAALGVSLREATVALLYRKRIGWLLILVFANLFTGAAIATFEDVISENFALLFFLPLLVASAGNAGSQAACLMVRVLATDEMRPGEWLTMAGREVLVASTLGISMAVAVSLLGLWRGGPEIAVVVALTMVLVVVFASLVGLSLPVLLARFGADPATASTPLITTLADAGGVVIYFLIASAVLSG